MNIPDGFYLMYAAFMIAVGVIGVIGGTVALFIRAPFFGAIPPPNHPEIDVQALDRRAPSPQQQEMK